MEASRAKSADAGTAPAAVPEGLALVVYDVDPANAGTRSFAIRVVNPGDSSVISTSGLGVQLDIGAGERIDALVRFVHDEVPPGSSAVATVRAEGVPDVDAVAYLVYDGADLDSSPLP